MPWRRRGAMTRTSWDTSASREQCMCEAVSWLTCCSPRGDAVDEREWLNCDDPQPMVEFLRVSGRPTERKLRLFSCACVRRVWPHLADERDREAVRVAERFADGSALVEQVAAANEAAWHGVNFDAPA